MLDNELIALVIATLIAGEATAGIANTPIKQAFQPTNQGVDTRPTAYLHKLGDRRYGFTGRFDAWDDDNSRMVHTEVQQYETTLQFSALATQNPETPQQYTASDILNLCASILQSSSSIQSLHERGVGVERITDVRNPYFLDDRHRWEASPSFDATFTHKQVITSYSPVATSTELQILTV